MARILEIVVTNTKWDGESIRAFDARNEVEPYKECRGKYGCGFKKPRAAFHKCSASKDGLARICKLCKSEKNQLDYDSYIEWFRFRDANRDKLVTAAHSAVHNAMSRKNNPLVAPEKCESCGRRAPDHAHHDNYAAPLDVRFLCAGCHKQWHETHEPAHEQGVEPVLKLRPAPRWREDEQRKAA